jgi:hypothetical protein
MTEPSCERLRRPPASDLDSIRRGGNREEGKSTVYPDEATRAVAIAWRVAAFGVEVRSLKVETHIPADAMAPDRGVEDPGTWRDDRLSVRVGLGDGAKQTSKVTGVIMHSNCPDGWQCHRARMALADSDAKAASLVSSIPEPNLDAPACRMRDRSWAGVDPGRSGMSCAAWRLASYLPRVTVLPPQVNALRVPSRAPGSPRRQQFATLGGRRAGNRAGAPPPPERTIPRCTPSSGPAESSTR